MLRRYQVQYRPMVSESVQVTKTVDTGLAGKLPAGTEVIDAQIDNGWKKCRKRRKDLPVAIRIAGDIGDHPMYEARVIDTDNSKIMFSC